MNQQVCLSGVLKNDACKDSTLILWKSALRIWVKPNNKSCRSGKIPIKKNLVSNFSKKKMYRSLLQIFLNHPERFSQYLKGFLGYSAIISSEVSTKTLLITIKNIVGCSPKIWKLLFILKKICLWSSKKQIIDRYKFRKLCAIFVQNFLPQSSQIQIFVKNITSPAGDSANYLSGTMKKFRISSNPSI